ncbi:cytochrome c-type biogenesis protein CcmH [Natronospira proteinivora]|uniref:Cytochrome c-type biogenesis protein n=1 Tax=Natronospira proteinivora TaxID=1807133 RepID=A0ABT1G6A3_9GAMM|nr:cytochrome c-type biogenesis protein [Natronospira proteinivora]MCP1726825.1 cytochrome c-type biogenesis protein CcmH [Natronospira proteinivora]
MSKQLRAFPLGLLLLVLMVLTVPVMAFDTHEPFEDPALEARYHRLINELRCLVCQNESIAESDAELAQDLRARTREMLAQGASDEEIKRYMTDRYGDFVLYRPPMRGDTMALWFGPAILLLIGAIVLIVTLRRRARLEAEEESSLEDER